MPEPKPSELRLVNVGTAERSDTFAALQLATPTGRLRRVDLSEGQALELASILLAIAARDARSRAALAGPAGDTERGGGEVGV